MYEVNWLAIVIAGVANIMLGMIWYNKHVFGTAWMNAARLNAGEMNASIGRMVGGALGGAVTAMIMAYVLTYFGMAWGVFDIIGAVELSLWTWLGFVMPVLLGSVLWEQKSCKLFFINAGFWFVAMCVMSSILVVFV